VYNLGGYDYSIGELNKRLIIPTRDEEAARHVRQVFDEEKRRAVIVFSPTILHADGFSAMLRRYGFRAETISSETEPRQRDVLSSFMTPLPGASSESGCWTRHRFSSETAIRGLSFPPLSFRNRRRPEVFSERA
jgi:hypothetical protein